MNRFERGRSPGACSTPVSVSSVEKSPTHSSRFRSICREPPNANDQVLRTGQMRMGGLVEERISQCESVTLLNRHMSCWSCLHNRAMGGSTGRRFLAALTNASKARIAIEASRQRSSAWTEMSSAASRAEVFWSTKRRKERVANSGTFGPGFPFFVMGNRCPRVSARFLRVIGSLIEESRAFVC
jgi:hypothetical protein